MWARRAWRSSSDHLKLSNVMLEIKCLDHITKLISKFYTVKAAGESINISFYESHINSNDSRTATSVPLRSFPGERNFEIMISQAERKLLNLNLSKATGGRCGSSTNL